MNDTDFEQFIKLLDAALVSDDKKIKTALRKFMFIMALNLSDDECEPGPFTKMMDTIDELQRRVSGLESTKSFTTTTDPYTQTWPYGTGIGTTGTPGPYVAPSTTGGQSTSSGTTQWMNVPSASTTGTVTTITGNSTTTANILLGGTNCWSTGTDTYTITTGDENTGTEIKDEIKDKLAALANSA